MRRREERRRIGNTDRVAGRDRSEGGIRQPPGVGVERIRQQRGDVGGNRSTVDRRRAAALVAVARVVEHVQVLAASLQIVTNDQGNTGSGGALQDVAVAAETAERQVRPAVGDAVGGLPVIRPGCEARLVDAIRRVADACGVERSVAQHRGELADDVGGVLLVLRRRGRVVRVAGAERIQQARVVHLAHQTHLRRQFLIEAYA